MGPERIAQAGHSQRPRLARRRRGCGRWLLPALSLPALIFLVLLLLALALRVTPAQLVAQLDAPVVRRALRLSLLTTAMTTAISVVAGTPLAYVLARRRLPGRSLIDTLLDLPMVLPPSVAGIALLVAFGRRGLLGQQLQLLGLSLAFSTAAVVLAQTFVAAPFYIKAALTGFAGVDRELEQAAALDGATGWQRFRLVTVPLAWPALLSGTVMTWARALGEFGATIIFAGNFPGRTQTMPLAIYVGFEQNFDAALALAIVLLVVSGLVLALVKLALRQQREVEP